MKSTFASGTLLITLLLIGARSASFAQCSGHFVLSSSKTEHLDDNGNVQESVDEKTTVEINGNNITVHINGPHDEKMTGTVTTNDCHWQVPFKEGKSKMAVTLSNENGESRDFAVNIEGKAGSVTLTATSGDGSGQKIRLNVDEFAARD